MKLHGPLIAGSCSPPTMMDIICFPLQDSKVDLTKEVGTNYRQFGILLLEDQTGAHISALERELMKNAQDINYRVFQEWLHGKGRRPVSWETLISVLEDIGLNQLAKSIRDTVIWKGNWISSMVHHHKCDTHITVYSYKQEIHTCIFYHLRGVIMDFIILQRRPFIYKNHPLARRDPQILGLEGPMILCQQMNFCNMNRLPNYFRRGLIFA